MAVFRDIGTPGPRVYTQAQADRLIVDYGTSIQPGTIIRISDEGVPPGDIYVYDGAAWVIQDPTGPSSGGGGPVHWSDILGVPMFAGVAYSGNYGDLGGLPTLFSGNYIDLVGKPTLFDGQYSSLTGTPTFATVATTGNYTDLLGKPTLFDGQYSSLTGKPSLAAVASSGLYTDLTGRPSISAVGLSGQYSDVIGTPALAAVATSGAYSDLTGTPTLAEVATSGSYSDLTGSPSISEVGLTGQYGDLLGKPTLFDGAYSSLTGAPTLATVATSGAYSDLSGLPTLSTVAHTGLYTDIIGTPPAFPVLTNTYFVSKNGSDGLGDGSMAQPFATIQKAHDAAASTNAIGDFVVIIVYPGNYAGAVNWTRPRTTIYGFAGSATATTISGHITINSTIDTGVGSPYLNIFGFQNVLLGGSGDSINMTGTVPAMLVLDGVKFESKVAGSRAVVVNITNATQSIMHWTVVDSNMVGGASAAFDLTNVNGYARQFSSESSAMPALYIRTGRLFINGGGFEANGGGIAAVVVGDGSATQAVFQASNVYILQDANNQDAVSVASNGVAILDDVQLDASGTGFAVNGVAGGVLEYAYLTFGTGSTKVAAALTSTAIPTTPTFV